MRKKAHTALSSTEDLPRIVIDCDEDGDFVVYSNDDVKVFSRHAYATGDELYCNFTQIMPNGWLDSNDE